MLFPSKVIVPPSHTGELDEGVATGSGFTVTETLAGAEVHPPDVTVSVYVPASAAVAFGIEGSSDVLLKEFGPVQAYVPEIVGDVRLIVCPAHTGLLLPGVAVGTGFTVTVTGVRVVLTHAGLAVMDVST